MSNTTDAPTHVTAQNFPTDVLESAIPVVIDFWAPWCAPCRAIGPVLDNLAKTYAGRVKVAKVNVDEEPELANAFKVRSIPTIAAMRGKEVVDVQVGFGGPGALQGMFDKLVAQASAPAQETLQ